MADLISRAAAIDAIVSATSLPDVDSIKSLYDIGNGEEWVDGVYDAIIAVGEVNAVDAIPVEWLVNLKNEYAREGHEQAEGDLMNLLLMWRKEQEAQDGKA